MATEPTAPSFAALTVKALDELSDARAFISRTVSELTGTQTLTHSDSDLPILQVLADHVAMKHANYDAWVALGVAFGDALIAHIPGLRWRLVTDQFGPHAALQFKEKALSIAAPTMLWKRVERGESVDLTHLATELHSFVADHAHEYSDG